MSLVRIPFFDPRTIGKGLRVIRDTGPLMAAAPETFTEPPVYPWDGKIIPTPAQRGDSCNAEGACKELSIAILAEDPEAIPHGVYLRPWPVYERARNLFWSGQGMDGGLYPSQSYDAMHDLDCVPPDTGVFVSPLCFSLVLALAKSGAHATPFSNAIQKHVW
jgi:hypothetical protein